MMHFAYMENSRSQGSGPPVATLGLRMIFVNVRWCALVMSLNRGLPPWLDMVALRHSVAYSLYYLSTQLNN